MTRTTIDLDASVLRDLRQRARRDRRSMGQLASELLAHALRSEVPVRAEITWHSQPMGARVDIDDTEALYRALDER
jgi:plasmid stability protein